MISPDEALQRLRGGNRRFVLSAGGAGRGRPSEARLAELAEGQEPFAIILGCSDSRVPPETVFDQGPGDLFVVRVAGNVVGPSQLESIEFAAGVLGTRLVVVLGHSQCGAVEATVEQARRPPGDRDDTARTIVHRILPAVEKVLPTTGETDRAEIVSRAVRANVHASVARLRVESDLLQRLAEEDGLIIVGAEYALETGVVEFLDPV